VEPAEEKHTDRSIASPSLLERTRARLRGARTQSERVTERLQEERQRHAAVAAVFEMADHDAEVGGGIMAGALAYRLFIWLLPLALVAVAGLGFASQAGSTSPEGAAKSMGLAGLVSDSVAGAAQSSARWYALVIGIPLLVITTRSVLRTLIVVHRLVWKHARGAVPKPTVGATVQLLGVFVMYLVLTTLASAARGWSLGGGLLVTLLIPVPYAALWLLVSLRLPHRDATWRNLVPGAVVFGLGIEVLHVVVAYVIAPQAESKQGTYGALGVAAALLLGLFLISRLVVATAVVNSTLVRRGSRPG